MADHPAVSESRFRAMGSDCHLIVVGASADAVGTGRRRIDDLERKWSRFLVDSEVSELNRRAGEAVEVSDDTVLLIERAVDAWRLSGGNFDPTVLGAVIRAGYDRSFEELGAEVPSGVSPLGVGVEHIEISGRSVRLRAGVGFDPGGIGKGLAADLVAEAVMAGAQGVCVNLGGDVRAAGTGPDGGGWTVAVEHEWAPEPLILLGVNDGAVATSTTLRRRWTTDGRSRHHLIDPQTGLPSDTDLNQVTVVAGQAWAAEVLAKAVLLRGSSSPFDIVEGTGAEALIVSDEGRVMATPGLAAFLGGRPAPTHIEPPT